MDCGEECIPLTAFSWAAYWLPVWIPTLGCWVQFPGGPPQILHTLGQNECIEVDVFEENLMEGLEPELQIIKAIRCNIPLEERTLDAYLLPSGEKRLGVEGVGLALGYTERWFYNRTNRPSKWLEVLCSKGFTGAQTQVSVIRQDPSIRGASVSKTISVRDFTKIVAYEAIVQKNIDAIILLASFAEVGLEKVLDEAFEGRSIEFLLEKIVHYTQWTYEELQEVLLYNIEEVRALYPWDGWDLAGRRLPQ